MSLPHCTCIFMEMTLRREFNRPPTGTRHQRVISVPITLSTVSTHPLLGPFEKNLTGATRAQGLRRRRFVA
ncbi:hypothetical protein M422DRAFT_31703 [Sphaerobolus stellatus SS14]|uniref:Unplaced genomic scaffold SPHSTscaffold_61, whole genome shotgun sequence n=1 Tax=Sphaerobolus stellatus (strain SS14) TaxID=990650 RepID=A0A0C9UER5_SPHS4|nr:hypothetical protein M422DRAFT_31703 [Sphaerobolus stellatus SS14]